MTTLIAGVLAAAFLPLGQIEIVGGISSWSALVVYAAVNAALIILRHREPDAYRGFRVPLSIGRFPLLPALSILITLALSINFGWITIALGPAIAGLGILAYPFLQR